MSQASSSTAASPPTSSAGWPTRSTAAPGASRRATWTTAVGGRQALRPQPARAPSCSEPWARASSWPAPAPCRPQGGRPGRQAAVSTRDDRPEQRAGATTHPSPGRRPAPAEPRARRRRRPRSRAPRRLMTDVHTPASGDRAAWTPTSPCPSCVSQLTADFSALVTTHVELAKVEIKEEVAKAGKGAGMLGGGALAAVMAVLLLSFAAAWGLAEVMARGLGVPDRGPRVGRASPRSSPSPGSRSWPRPACPNRPSKKSRRMPNGYVNRRVECGAAAPAARPAAQRARPGPGRHRRPGQPEAGDRAQGRRGAPEARAASGSR